MNDFKELLDDNIINREELFNKRYEYLGLDSAQAGFVSKIFLSKRENYSNLDVKEVSSIMSVDETTAQKILTPLITQGLILLEKENDKTVLNFEHMFEKLLSTYIIPSENSPVNLKVNWIVDKSELDLNESNIKELKDIVENHNWNTLIKVVENFVGQKDKTFPLLLSLIKVTTNSKDKLNNDIKSVMDVNWLK